ncbi:MAG: hypothetical protein ACM3X7_12705 [Solirubrobacterales bacterium]
MNNTCWPETVVLWGAGATKALGLYETRDLVDIVLSISKKDFSFLDDKNETLKESFLKLVTEDLINEPLLSKTYDFKALEAIIKTNPHINMHELFTMIDQLIYENMGFNVFYNGYSEFLRVDRVIGAKRCLILLVEELERVSIQKVPGFMDPEKVKPYFELADMLTELMKEEALYFDEKNFSRESRKFYLYSYAIISFNWDTVLLWNIFNSNKLHNSSPVIFKDGLKLNLSTDFGTQIALADTNDENYEISYGSDETQCKAVNSRFYPSRVMRIGKFIFPHGMFGSRICPECGKYITTFGGMWDRYGTEIFGPSVFDKLQKNWKYRTKAEVEQKKGAIECPYCCQITYPYDMPLIMQTLAKKKSIPKLEEVKNEMGLLIKNAKHIVFAGYSLPLDDIMVKTFFMTILSGNDKNNLKCSIVNFDSDYNFNKNWMYGDDIKRYLKESTHQGSKACIKNVCDIFKLNNVRVSLKGIPYIFSKDGSCNRELLIELLYPKEYFPKGFPVDR